MDDVIFKPQGAIFDLDGLMLDTETSLIFRLSSKAREYGFDVPAGVLLKTIGINHRASAAIVRAELGWEFPYEMIRAKVIPEEEQSFEAHGIPQKAGLTVLLDALAEKKIPVVVATSTDRERARKKLLYGGIAPYFKLMVCGDEVAHGKPDPEIFLRAAELIGVPPSLCAGFEDSPAGLRALAAAGIHSVFIKDSVEPDAETLATVWKRFAVLSDAIALF